MPDNPLTPEFWSAEDAAYWEAVGPLIMAIILSGAEAGVTALPVEAQVLMNWDVFSQAAIDFIRGYRVQWVRGISNTTRTYIVNSIQDWIEAGEPLPLLQDRLEKLPGLSANRAKQIAVTEVTRAYAEGNIMAWRTTGYIGGKRWNTAEDDRVCPTCGPLAGMIVQLDSNGFTTEAGGLGITAPPAHPGCRCWLTPVVDLSAFEDNLDRILEEELRRAGR